MDFLRHLLIKMSTKNSNQCKKDLHQVSGLSDGGRLTAFDRDVLGSDPIAYFTLRQRTLSHFVMESITECLTYCLNGLDSTKQANLLLSKPIESNKKQAESHTAILFKKWANPDLFFIYFRSFQTNNTILQQIYVKKCPSSIQC